MNHFIPSILFIFMFYDTSNTISTFLCLTEFIFKIEAMAFYDWINMYVILRLCLTCNLYSTYTNLSIFKILKYQIISVNTGLRLFGKMGTPENGMRKISKIWGRWKNQRQIPLRSEGLFWVMSSEVLVPSCLTF